MDLYCIVILNKTQSLKDTIAYNLTWLWTEQCFTQDYTHSYLLS